jgi:signal transduction histidine kinase
VKCVPIYDAENIHTGWILRLVDVSSIRQTERDREEAFRFITHDIRSPLSSIITILELYKLQPQEARATLMHRLERYADNALSLADNFVNLSRAKSGKYHFEALNLCDILSEVVDEAWTPSQARRINIQMVAGNQAAYAMIDRHMFKRALTNLISNAIKFSPEKSLILCAIDPTGDNWNISISDRGAGIPAETLSTLFQPFNRLHSRSHPHIDGTGLGLAFVHSVATRHGGSVHVTSAVNQGSTFYLTIPMAPS